MVLVLVLAVLFEPLKLLAYPLLASAISKCQANSQTSWPYNQPSGHLVNYQQTVPPIAGMTLKSNYKMPQHFPPSGLCLCHWHWHCLCLDLCPSLLPACLPRPPHYPPQLTRIQCVCNLCGNVAGLIMLINTNVALATLSLLLLQHHLLFAVASCHCKKHCILTGLRI